MSQSNWKQKINQAVKPASASTAALPDAKNYEQFRIVNSSANLVDRFAAMAAASGMNVTRTNRDSLCKELTAIISRHQIKTAMLGPGFEEMSECLLKNNVKIVFPNCEPERFVERAFNCDCSIAEPDFAIAETGSVVLKASPTQPRLLHLAAPVHVSILPAGKIKPDLLDIIPANGFFDRCVTFVTGPSKTADIEMTLVTGVHGPTSEYILIVE